MYTSCPWRQATSDVDVVGLAENRAESQIDKSCLNIVRRLSK